MRAAHGERRWPVGRRGLTGVHEPKEPRRGALAVVLQGGVEEDAVVIVVGDLGPGGGGCIAPIGRLVEGTAECRRHQGGDVGECTSHWVEVGGGDGRGGGGRGVALCALLAAIRAAVVKKNYERVRRGEHEVIGAENVPVVDELATLQTDFFNLHCCRQR